MNTNVNLLAPIGVMALLTTGFLLFVGLIGLIQSLLVRRHTRAKVLLTAMILITVAYLAAILIFSFASHEKVLARGAEKHFCEIDCHLAYSVVDARQEKTIGDQPHPITAPGSYLVVTIQTRFDDATVSARRGDGLLYPNSRVVTLFDERGNRYTPLGNEAPANQNPSGIKPLATPLRPGESYTTEVVFDLPADAKPSFLLINEGEWVTHLVIGHENSPLHRQTRFQL